MDTDTATLSLDDMFRLARIVLRSREHEDPTASVYAVAMWEVLTGIPDAVDALAYAETVVAQGDPS
jgi:hypothetical protein